MSILFVCSGYPITPFTFQKFMKMSKIVTLECGLSHKTCLRVKPFSQKNISNFDLQIAYNCPRVLTDSLINFFEKKNDKNHHIFCNKILALHHLHFASQNLENCQSNIIYNLLYLIYFIIIRKNFFFKLQAE